MSVQPTPEQWALLTPIERINFQILHTFNHNPLMKWILGFAASTIGMAWVEMANSRLSPAHGFDNFTRIDPTRGVLLVANHRSFFDLYVVSGRLFRLFGNHHRIFFPVRSTFFYDNPLGLAVNLPVGMGSMYPPILREPQRKEWNRFAMDLMVELLRDPRNMIGFHPEGTRNKGLDPYTLLPGRTGCGELIHRARPNVVPLFLQGFPRFGWHGPLLNLGLLGKRPVWAHMVMGEPMDFSSYYNLPPTQETYQAISDKVMARLHLLGQQEKAIRSAPVSGHT